MLARRATPLKEEYGQNGFGMNLISAKSVGVVTLVGHAGRREMWKDGACQEANVKTNALLGRQAVLCGAETASGGQLNPAHSRWLMGYPIEWDYCGLRQCKSSRKLPRASIQAYCEIA